MKPNMMKSMRPFGQNKDKIAVNFLLQSAVLAAVLLSCSGQVHAQNTMITSPQDVLNMQRDIARISRDVNRRYGSQTFSSGGNRIYVPPTGNYSPAAQRSLNFITGFNRDTAYLLKHPNDRRSDAIRRRGARDIATQRMLLGGMRYYPSTVQHY